MTFTFANPLMLCMLAFVPLMALWYFRKQSHARVKFSSIARLKTLPKSKWTRLRHSVPLLRIVAFAALVLALARPQFGRKSVEVLSDGVDIVLAIDTSGSMEALDFFLNGKRVTRLSVVKKVVASFVKNRQADRLGMVVFGEHAFTQCPLTLDHGIFLSFLSDIEIGSAGEKATAIGSAISTAVARLKDVKSKSKIIILLTDGSSNAGDITPETATDLAQSYGIKVYTIGAGSQGKAPFLVKSIFGERLTYQKVEMNEDLLKSIAQRTGGQYFRATGTKELTQVYAAIDKLEKTEIKIKEHVEFNDLYPTIILTALLLMLTETILAHTRFRRLP